MRVLTELRPYQRAAVAACLPHAGFFLYMAPRTGKTLVALSVMAETGAKKVLIVAPKVALPVWESQISQHLDCAPDELQLVNYEQLWGMRRFLRRWRPDLMIIDECHRIKHRASKQSRACRAIAKAAARRLGLSGTPTGQGYQDLWAQFAAVIPGRLSEKWSQFAGRYLKMGGFKKKQIVGYTEHIDELKQIVANHSYQLTLNEARGRVCRVLRRRHYVELEPGEQLAAYRGLEEGLIELVNGTTIETPLVITQIMKMAQITGGAVLDEEGTPHVLSTRKLTRLMSLLAEETEPVVIICRFLHEIEMIDDAISSVGGDPPHVIAGGRYEVPENFQVLILQVASGVSIDLSRASRIIYYSWDYSYLNFEQSRFRISSYNSTKITYDYLLARGTIDEVIYQALTRKQQLARTIINYYRRTKMETSEVESRAEGVRKELTGKSKPKAPKKAPAKKTVSKKEAVKAAPSKKPAAKEDNGISLSQLAEEAKMNTVKARRILRDAEVERPGGRWSWAPGSQALRAARKALGLSAT